jgi:uncharacterized membrane protein
MGLAVMILGLAVFGAAHVFTTRRAARAAVIARIGENPYKAIYSLISLIGLALIVYGFAQYRATGWIDLWHPPVWTRHLAATLLLPGSIILVAAYSRGYLAAMLKHPMLVAIKLWAVSHLLANGDLGSMILFGSFLGWAVFDRITLKRRADSGTLPISTGGFSRDLIAVVGGIALYLGIVLWFHPAVIGVPVFG